MPVSPAITDGSHAPLGVAENTLPLRSTTFTQLVSCTEPCALAEVVGMCPGPPILPRRLSIEACRGALGFLRSAPQLLESSVCSGVCERLGSPQYAARSGNANLAARPASRKS